MLSHITLLTLESFSMLAYKQISQKRFTKIQPKGVAQLKMGKFQYL